MAGMVYRFCIIFLLSLLFVAGCSDEEQHKAKNKAKKVEITTVVRRPIGVTRIISGTLEAIEIVEIFNQEQGRILQIPYYEGDSVEKDAVLVALDGSLIQAQLDKASASLKQARLDLKRQNRLIKNKLTSEDELARAKTKVDETAAEVNLLKTRLAHTRVRAPFAGVISNRYKSPGDVVPLHSHILTLIAPHSLKARFHVSEILLSHLEKGAPVSLRIDALGDKLHPARILRVHPVVDPLSRQGIVEAKLDPVPDGAVPGQLARLYLATETTPLRTIPLAALRHNPQGEYVFRVDAQDKTRITHVKTGLQLSGRVEILDGLQVGDKVITRGLAGLRDGKKVQVVSQVQTSSTPLVAKPMTVQPQAQTP